MAPKVPIRERFYNFVDKTEDCWLWKGATRTGYGLFRLDGRMLSAHRVSYVLENFTIPEGAVIHHKCGNRLCVKPDHLQCTDPQSNTAEMYERQSYLRAIKRLEKEVAELRKKLEEKQQ
jgi:hypothetical protein